MIQKLLIFMLNQGEKLKIIFQENQPMWQAKTISNVNILEFFSSVKELP